MGPEIVNTKKWNELGRTDDATRQARESIGGGRKSFVKSFKLPMATGKYPQTRMEPCIAPPPI